MAENKHVVVINYPVFDRLGGVGGFLLGVVMLEDVDDGHEVHLLPGSGCGAKQTPQLRTRMLHTK